MTKTTGSSPPMHRLSATPLQAFRQRHPWFALLMALSLAAVSGQASAAALQAANFQKLPGGGARVILQFSGTAPKPHSFSTQEPATLSLDLPGTANQLQKRFKDLDTGPLRSLAAVEANGRTRVVLGLDRSVTYDVRSKGDDVIITLGAARAAGSGQSPERITQVDFRRAESGAGQVVVSLSRPNAVANVTDHGGDVVVDFPHADVAKRLLQRLDVLDFNTVAKYVDVQRTDTGGTKLTVIPRAGSIITRTAYQTSGKFVLELQSREKARKAANRQQPKYTGKRISLNFQNVDIRALLQIIADVAHVNMVISDSVSGAMALRLDNVPWDQALHIILTTQGLGQTRQGNVIMVAPLKEIAARQAAEAAAEKQGQQLAPLRSEIVQINYAKASQIAALLKSSNNSLLSDRGKVSVDERTNTLLLQDTPERLAAIRKLVQRIDIPVRQVMIASRVVIATNTYARDLGAKFGVTYAGKSGNNLVTTSGTTTATDTMVSSFQQSGLPVSIPGLDNRFNVNLPASPSSGTAGSLAFGILGSDYLVDLELSALQAEGRGEVVSSPRVITANGHEASIEQGVEIPYQEAASSGATSVSFKKAVLSLQVTPQITPDGRIIMDLAVNKDSVGQTVTTAGGGSVPSIDTRKVTTQVLVNNGDTVVLGGIYEQQRNNNVSKIPLLGDIPLLGALFRNTHVDTSKDELLIFVTPKIISQQLNLH